MVRDGYLYALALIAAGVLVGWFAQPAWALAPILLAVFFLWFFRDPERIIPDAAGAVVSPGGGQGSDVFFLTPGARKITRISIFLSVFAVQGNPSPLAGGVPEVRYQRGKF